MKKIYKLSAYILVLALMLVTLVGCDLYGGNLTIGSSVKSSDIYVGEVLKLYSNAKDLELDCDVVWASSNPEVAKIETVDGNGILQALAAGETTISLTVGDKTTSVDITVLLKSETANIAITGSQTVKIGGNIQLSAEIYNSSSKAGFRWTSSDDSIATVDSDGKVTGVSGGLCTITATCKDDPSISGTTLVYVEIDTTTLTTIYNEIYQVSGDSDFTALSEKVIKVIEDNIDSVVGVSNYAYQNYTSDYRTFEKVLKLSAIGTGVIYKKEATETAGTYKYTLITNHHVIEDNDQIKIYIQSIEKDIEATVITSSKELDLAVVEFTYAIDITPAELGDIDTVKAGSFVVAIGHPTGYEYYDSSTFGIVSFVNRELTGEKSVYIQHDAAINSGNSGGPLFDMNGKVIGINTLKLASDDIDNMGFAISIQTVKDFLTKNNLLN